MNAIESMAKAIAEVGIYNFPPDEDDYRSMALAALKQLKNHPPVFGDINKRKGSLGNMYTEDQKAWSQAIDRLLSEEE